jgi:L-ascorbate metabolism protein UlaG (beta-lactamase superfamily)
MTTLSVSFWNVNLPAYILSLDMMVSRRTFLSLLAAQSVPATALADDRVTRWLQAIYNTDPPAPAPRRPEPAVWSNEALTASWIGHSTVLMNICGTIVLTDPVFSDRVGIRIADLFTIGPKRVVSPALTLKDLPPIDLIVLSHMHMDHCDLETLKTLDRSVQIVLPSNGSGILRELGFTRVTELDWSDSATIRNLTVQALPVEHRGARFPWEHDATEAGGNGQGSNAYLITGSGFAVVFAGDTAYSDGFRSLSERNIQVTLAILPIGGYIPHHDNHCTPEEAVGMAGDMNAGYVLPVHWGTFPGEEALTEPIERLEKALVDTGLRLAVREIGETCVITNGTNERN